MVKLLDTETDRQSPNSRDTDNRDTDNNVRRSSLKIVANNTPENFNRSASLPKLTPGEKKFIREVYSRETPSSEAVQYHHLDPVAQRFIENVRSIGDDSSKYALGFEEQFDEAKALTQARLDNIGAKPSQEAVDAILGETVLFKFTGEPGYVIFSKVAFKDL